ncbi:MAG TPA: MerR family transcriptional regulator [Aggregatilineaceae bacterium]|nr:MerR family transcriptional regulator [Aggregatilineaceae bacterium]
MIRIGDFSKLSHVSVKTLRFYDETGLLAPVTVDPFTGYRYYEFDQLPRLHRILALKDLGFSLEEIGQLLRDNLTPEQMRGMLKLRRAEIRQKVQEETDRMERVEARLRQIEQEDCMSQYDIVIKRVEALKVASVREVVPGYAEQGGAWKALEGYLAMQRVRPSAPCLTIYYDEGYKERDVDLEVCEPLAADLPEGGRVKVRTLPPVESMACTVHKGPFTTISDAYTALIKWVDANGYRICGPGREVYLREAKQASQTDPNTVTEVQFPVEKVKQ